MQSCCFCRYIVGVTHLTAFPDSLSIVQRLEEIIFLQVPNKECCRLRIFVFLGQRHAFLPLPLHCTKEQQYVRCLSTCHLPSSPVHYSSVMHCGILGGVEV